MTKIDLQELVGGKSFSFPCTITKDGIGVTVTALVDTGANGYVFIDRTCAGRIAERLGLQKTPLGRDIPVKDYQGRNGNPIQSILTADLWIDGRMEYEAPMLELDTGPGSEVLLGRIWLAYHGILPDPRRHRLLWPEERPREDYHRVIGIPYSELVPQSPDPIHQRDADRRDKAMELQDQRARVQRERQQQQKIRILQQGEPITKDNPVADAVSPGNKNQELTPNKPPEQPKRARWSKPSTWKEDMEACYRKMDSALSEPPSPAESTIEDTLYDDIIPDDGLRPEELDGAVKAAIISVVAFRKLFLRDRQERHQDYDLGLVTISQVQQAIEDKKRETQLPANEDEETRRLVEAQLERFPYLKEFADVFSKRESDQLPPHRDCDHRIELSPGSQNPLRTSPLYSLTLDQLEAMKKYLIDNLRKGFIEPSNAPYGSPVLFARKHDGSWRFCVDYRKLNAATVKDKYPLPLIDETLRQLGKAKIYTKIDIRQAFHRIRMDPASEDLTTFRTRYGQFRYKVLPFGLCNGPATFQRFINSQIFEYLDVFVAAFIDDLIIYSDNEDEHRTHVKLVLQKLRAAGLQADIKKCEFHTRQTKFLGFIVGTDGIRVDPQKIEAVSDWTRPKTVREVQAFLGFCNFYRRFVEKFGHIARPLQKLTLKDKAFVWTAECEEAFEELKSRMTSTPLLIHYDPAKETRVETDASDGVVAGVLSQKVDNDWRPVGYFSKTMQGAEHNYPIHDKELLAIVRAVEEWYPLLLGLEGCFEVLTDHHALQYFMTKRLLNARQAGWAELLAPLNFRILYRPGKLNAAADALSRKAEDLATQKEIQAAYRTQVLLPPHKLDPGILEGLQDSDVEDSDAEDSNICHICAVEAAEESQQRPHGYELIDSIIRTNRESESLASFREIAATEQTDWRLKDGLLVKGGRLVVPVDGNLRTYLLAEFHEQLATAHPGRNKMRALVARQYFWPRMMSDIDRYVRNCLTCRRSHKPRDRPPGLLKPLELPDRPWQHVTMDFHAMPPDKAGYDQVFVVVDRLGKRSYSLPCYKTTTAKEMAFLYYQHVWRDHGAPETITSDRGPQFISEFWDEFCKILGIRIRLSSAEHPQTDGQTEIMNQYLDQRLRPFVNHFQDNWSELLPAMDYAQAILPHESTGMAPFEVETGCLPRMSYDWEERTRKFGSPREELNRTQAQEFVSRIEEAVQFARGNLLQAQAAQKKQADKHRREADFEPGQWVMVTKGKWQTNRPSDKLDNPMAGPFKIVKRKGHSYLLDLPAGWKIHPVFTADRLRKAPSDPLPGQELSQEPPIEVDGELEWQVVRIVASRLNRGTLEYRAQWLGWDEDPIWYPARNFKNSPHLLRQYHDEFPAAAGPPKRLAQWTKAYLEDVFDDDHPDDDQPEDPGKAGSRTRRRRKL